MSPGADIEMAVKVKGNNVQFILSGITFSETRRLKIGGGDILGIDCNLGQLWVSQVESIDIYSMSGVLLKDSIKLGSKNFSNSP